MSCLNCNHFTHHNDGNLGACNAEGVNALVSDNFHCDDFTDEAVGSGTNVEVPATQAEPAEFESTLS